MYSPFRPPHRHFHFVVVVIVVVTPNRTMLPLPRRPLSSPSGLSLELKSARLRSARVGGGPAGEQRGNAAGDDGDDEHDDMRGFHTLTPYNHTATGTWSQLPHDAPTDTWPCMLDFSR